MRWFWVGVFLAGSLPGCKGAADKVSQNADCAAGQVRDTAGNCLASCDPSQQCGVACCAAGQSCQPGNVCGPAGPAGPPCGSGPACGADTFCLGGSCVSADPKCSF